MKKLYYAMSRRRVSCPQSTQQLWDAIKIIRYQRQIPHVDRISKYMSRVHNVGIEEVTRQLNYCVRDGLLHLTKHVGNKGCKAGVETEGYKLPGETMEKDSHDWYCFECHRGGDVISCNTCHRVYHLACIDKEELPETDVKHKFVCGVCKAVGTRDVNTEIKRSKLNRLLRLTLKRMKVNLPMSLTERHMLCNASATPLIFERPGSIRRPSSELPSTIKWVNDDKDLWRQDYLLYRPMDLQMMEKKVHKNKYETTEEFKADAQTIVHNVVIYHGVHSIVADHARLMLRDCIGHLQEIRQCQDCYKVQHAGRTNKNWFCKPCRPPHILVYAKLKGLPYWPAKVMNIEGDTYVVRLFGGKHEKHLVEKAYIRPISININSLQVRESDGSTVKKTSHWTKACEQLKRHQEQLEKLRIKTNNFTAMDSSSDESDEDSSDQDVKEVNRSLNESRPILEQSNIKREDESDMSDFSEDDEEAPLLKRLKRDSETSSIEATVPIKEEKEVQEEEIQTVPTKSKALPISRITKAKRKPGRPPSLSPKKAVKKKTSQDKESLAEAAKVLGKRGRPPGSKSRNALLKEEMIEMQRKLEKEFEERKRLKDEEELRRNEQEHDVKEEEEEEEEDADETEEPAEKIEITSTSIPTLTSNKKEEEEMVSSSCQEPQVRSIAVQTKPLPTPEPAKKPPEQPSQVDVAKIREEVEDMKNREIERLNLEHQEEIAGLLEKHKLYVTEIKKKQWCFNCESEAIYHCCWNTAYCSIDCQQLHWQKEHKRVCRRKR